MMADEFKIGRKVRVTEDVDLSAQSHGPMGFAPIVVQAGEIAVVTDTNLPDFVTLTFDREIPFPADFGGPSREVHSHDPAVSSGLTFDLLQPVHEI